MNLVLLLLLSPTLLSFLAPANPTMTRTGSLLVSAAAVLTGVLPGAHAEFEETCAGLSKQLALDNATVTLADFVAAGTNISLPGLDPSCGAPFTVAPADICRVGLTLATSERSSTKMEAWLPRNWTGRFVATGNGGLNGCIDFASMAYTSNLGFAATGSDNGHSGQNGTTMLNNIEVVKDFAWRALDTSVAVGKQVASEFYGKKHDKSYYFGCSTGGRQGWKMAQDFPDNFDGVVAGAPAFAFNNLTSWSGTFFPIIKAAGADGFPTQALAALDAELLRQCDEIDGAKDGIIEEPSLCNFRPEALICSPETNSPSSECITGKQAETVRKIYSDLHGINGDLVYPRMQPGAGILGMIFGIYGSADEQFLYTDHWFKFAVYNDPNFDTSVVTPKMMADAWSLDAGSINTWSGDLSKFAGRGSKILHYHGQEDSIISSSNSNRYYDHVSRTMGKPAAELDDFYRFFRISGMSHCQGGPGATAIGQGDGSSASLDPEENVLMAMVRWVEEGKAPERIVGTAFVNQTASAGVDYKRAHCKFPLRNVYKGPGDVKEIDSWKCI
ncbi:feruloyl esterase B-2 [Apiospora marii]|uniref:Carboxylic ester hydrolase n=1 Tax=Apiospora marii TaxID=335849 RepID=A0ABR1S9W9_9PEZI